MRAETYYNEHSLSCMYACIADSTFSLLPNFLSPFTSVRLCSSEDLCAGFFPRCLPQGDRARGDPDREIVGIRSALRAVIWPLCTMDRSVCVLRANLRLRAEYCRNFLNLFTPTIFLATYSRCE